MTFTISSSGGRMLHDGIAIRLALVLFGLTIAFVMTEIGTRAYIRARAHDSIAMHGYGTSESAGATIFDG